MSEAASLPRSIPPGADVAAGGPSARGGTRGLLRLVGSFPVAVFLVLLLLLLTFVGTIEQSRMSLYDAQKKYFESVYVLVDVGPLAIPLPGASLVMALLAVNLVVGGVIRLRRGWATAGILVAHLGVLTLFASGLVETIWSDKGQMTIRTGESSDTFRSYTDWEVAIVERRDDGSATEFVVPWKDLHGLDADDVLDARSSRLPFDVVVTGWTRNARPRPASADARGANGWTVQQLEPAMEAEQNLPAAFVSLVPKDGGPAVRGLSWGREQYPWTATLGGRTWQVDLRRRSWTVPFSLRLGKFVHKEHPGTSIPSEFSSYVTKVQGGVERDVHITMNEPLRHDGYTFFQSNWGPQQDEDPHPETYFSVFSVVKNPSDQWPVLGLAFIVVGLLFQFGRKLVLHVRAEAKRRRTAEGVA